MVRSDARISGNNIAVYLQPGLFILHIGGQARPWKYHVDRKRLRAADLTAYGREIVEDWERQRDRLNGPR
jgi:ornithine cyclodeaminase/alanine dehydrogenase-like protein (mu-crystallin family)